jgi:predicted exporter
MNRTLPWLWASLVALVFLYAVVRAVLGISLQSNILALLPQTERDVTVQRIQDGIAKSFSRRVVFLIGHANPTKARIASRSFSFVLKQSGAISSLTTQIDPDAQRKIGAALFPYRAGLLSNADRTLLAENEGEKLVTRARATMYGPGGFASGTLFANDPFLLLPAYLLALPVPQSRLNLEDGALMVRDRGISYVLVSAELSEDAYTISFQERFDSLVKSAWTKAITEVPGTTMLRAGAIFYAHDGAREATAEISSIGLISIIGTLALLLFVFRSVRPLLLGFIAIAIGILFAFAGTLAIFGQIHVVALLLGVSLIGISVDYSLQYFCEYFDPDAKNPLDRLRLVLPGVAIGLSLTLVGYLTLLFAPFPGLRQVAIFSVIGLIGSVGTVCLWFPVLDMQSAPKLSGKLVDLAAKHWLLWESPALRYARSGIVGLCVLLAAIGACMLRADDDVRHLQSLSPELKHQEAEIRRLTGSMGGTEFLLIRGTSEQALLETEEKLIGRLSFARQQHVLDDFQAVSQFVPSVARQRENRSLVRENLIKPYLASYMSELGYAGRVDGAPTERFLTPKDLPLIGPLSLLSLLNATSGSHPAHVVLLDGVKQPGRLRTLTEQVPGVRFVDLTSDWSNLFGTYRRYALLLLVVSAGLMYPIHAWRYGWRDGAMVMVPSLSAATLAPLIGATVGIEFTFFNAMALVLVLSIGVDYSIFSRETSGVRKPVTMLAIALAALSTILSFGLLALSRVFAVHAFGMTMLIGIVLAFLLAPIAGGTTRSRAAP